VAELNQALQDPQIEAASHITASDQTGRMLNYLNDFLGLVALVGLFLSGLGSAYLFRSFLSRRLKDMAVLLTLGLTRSEIQRVYLVQMAFLGAAAGIVGLAASYLLLPILIHLVKQLTPIEIFIFFDPLSVVTTVGLGILTSVLVGLPLLARIQTLKAAELFREDYQPQGTLTSRAFIYFVPLFICFWILSVWQANSFKIGSIFVGSFWGAAVLLGLLSYWGLKILSRMTFAGIIFKLPLRSLARNRLSTASCFLALGLGSLLLNLIPQLQTSLQAELQSPDRVLPSLFLFDIQEEQLAEVQQVLKQEKLELTYLSPLVRARIDSVNGKPFEKVFEPGRALTREQEQEERSRNRGYNLTYRSQLSESEELVEGRMFSEKSGDIAEISVEERFAGRLNFKIGDLLKFDIQGVELAGRVVNLRRVRWTSFQPNFFVVFQPGFLEQAPKTFLASVGKVDDEVKNRLQMNIVQKIPNVSIIDVERLIENILTIANQMSWALKFMALLSIFSGMVVLFSIANHQVRLRRWDLNLMKTLGAGLGDLYKMVAVEFGLLAFTAAVCGGSISLLVSFGIARVLFDGSYDYSLSLIIYSAIGTTIMAIAVALIASRRTLNLKPLDLLGTGQRN
jgi:putative ABC transport system permease protein